MCGVELSINYFLHFICCFSCFGIFKKISQNANFKKKRSNMDMWILRLWLSLHIVNLFLNINRKYEDCAQKLKKCSYL